MGIILWLVFGAIVGWIASAIMGSREGLLMDIVVGIVGAALGGWLMSMLGGAPATGFDLYSFIVAIVGAVVLIGIVRAIRGASYGSPRRI